MFWVNVPVGVFGTVWAYRKLRDNGEQHPGASTGGATSLSLLTALNGIGGGMFAAPNSSSIMSSVPARYRLVASGMRSTYQNSGTALSIGVFFSLMIVGLASSLPGR